VLRLLVNSGISATAMSSNSMMNLQVAARLAKIRSIATLIDPNGSLRRRLEAGRVPSQSIPQAE
jgi:hypothetical protein